MLVLGINRVLNWCQVLSNGRKYTCPTQEINGGLFFKFKNAWHPIANYVCEHTEQLVREGEHVFSRPFKK